MVADVNTADLSESRTAHQNLRQIPRLLEVSRLPDETLVYPAHDYKGDTVSSIAEETAFNPRLQIASVEEYVAMMDSLDLPNPMMMDVAVPANLKVGLSQDETEARGWSLTCDEAQALLASPDVVLVDLRDNAERDRRGVIAGSVHAPYTDLDEHVHEGGLLHALAASTGRRLVLYCAYGERSAMAVQAAQEPGLTSACHIRGGIDAWEKRKLPTEAPGGHGA